MEWISDMGRSLCTNGELTSILIICTVPEREKAT